jgi:hypothetical protein
MTITTTALPKHLAELAAAADALDEELAAAMGKYERLCEAEERLVALIQQLAQATSDRARADVLARLRAALPDAELPASLDTTAGIRKLGVVAADSLRRLVEQEEAVEAKIHALAAQRDRAAAAFAEAAHEALLAEPGLRPALRKVMGLTDGGRP